MAFARARLSGDYLQTSAIFDEQLRRAVLVTDPNDYAGPGTGYEPAPSAAGRDRRHPPGARGRRPARRAGAVRGPRCLRARGPASPGQGPRGRRHRRLARRRPATWRCLSGLAVTDVLREMLAGLEEEGCVGRVVRFGDKRRPGPDRRWPRPGWLTRGSGIGLQGKGTALIHRRDLAPLANLELYSVAPSVTPHAVPAARRQRRAARQGRHARPGQNPYSDEAIEARYHTTVIALMELERRHGPGAAPKN